MILEILSEFISLKILPELTSPCKTKIIFFFLPNHLVICQSEMFGNDFRLHAQLQSSSSFGEILNVRLQLLGDALALLHQPLDGATHLKQQHRGVQQLRFLLTLKLFNLNNNCVKIEHFTWKPNQGYKKNTHTHFLGHMKH